MSKSDSNSSGGIGFVGLLQVAFIVLKLIPSGNGHIINWSWFWVLAPTWITIAIVLVILAIVILAIALKD